MLISIINPLQNNLGHLEMKAWKLSFSYLSHNILILKLLVCFEFLQVSVLSSIFRNGLKGDLLLLMIHSLSFIYGISGKSSDNFTGKKPLIPL